MAAALATLYLRLSKLHLPLFCKSTMIQAMYKYWCTLPTHSETHCTDKYKGKCCHMRVYISSEATDALAHPALWTLACTTSFAVCWSSGLDYMHCSKDSKSASSAGQSYSFAIKTPIGQLVSIHVSRSAQLTAQILLVAGSLASTVASKKLWCPAS